MNYEWLNYQGEIFLIIDNSIIYNCKSIFPKEQWIYHH